MASVWAKSPSLARGSAATLSLLLQCEKSRLIVLRNVPSFFLLWLRVSGRLLEFAVHHHPGFTSGDNVVPLTRNMCDPVSTSF